MERTNDELKHSYKRHSGVAVVERDVERWASECLYTSYVTIPGLRYQGAGRRRPSGTTGRSRRSYPS